MRTADLDILMIPGRTGSGPDHWQTRWESRLSTARRVVQGDWDRPGADWIERVVAAVGESRRPVVFIAHSCGVPTVVHAAPRLPPGRVVGAYLVAPPSESVVATTPEIDAATYLPYPRRRLGFPSVLVASRTDPALPYAEAETLARDWGAALSDAGDAGHLNTASGHGPWPEGLMRFAGFLKGL